jgi:hypothetical protein
MAADYVSVRARIFTRYPHFRSSLFEQRALFERKSEPLAPDLHSREFHIDQAAMAPRT